jgi:hypothetical protein
MPSLSEAGASGVHADVLRALLAALTADYSDTDDVRTKAALAGQIRAASADLAALTADDAKVGDQVDEIAERRAARGAGPASGQGRARPRSS